MTNPIADEQQILSASREIEPWVIDIRRRLHQCPELLYELHDTQAIVCEELDKLGIRFESGVAKTGVVATLGDNESSCVALRADMDALPITEEADVSFRSKNEGRMHACGHDCHTAMLLGAARLLKENESKLPGTVKLFFQPAEEGGAGANQMCQHGVMKNPDVQKVFGIHVWPYLPTGRLTGRPGPFLAATNSFKITVDGVGGHAAFPHLCKDPVLTASKIVVEVQSIISREQDPLAAAVISCTAVNGGFAHNVIPAQMEIKGTIRSLSAENVKAIKIRVEQIAEGIAKANLCTAKFETTGVDYPETSNDETLWNQVTEMGQRLLGPDTVEVCDPMMGGEDFAYYGAYAPSCFVALGTRNEAEGCIHGLHHPKFKADESAFRYGTALHVSFALEHLTELASGTKA